MPKSKACLRGSKQDAHNPVPRPCPKNGKRKNSKVISPAPESSTKYTNVIPRNNAARAHEVPFPSNGKTKAAATLDDKVLNIRKAISLLFLLAKAPAGPPLNALQSTSSCMTERWANPPLSLAMEVNLVEVFTFLVSTTNDPYKVAALSLESKVEARTAVHRLKIAANHGELEPTKCSLERIFASLRQGTAQEQSRELRLSLGDGPLDATSSKLDVVLHNILVMHCNRILCRLRSHHAQWRCNFKRSKMSRPPILKQMFNTYDKQQRQDRVLPVFHKDMDLLRGFFSSLENLSPFNVKCPHASVTANLGHIVMMVYRLWQQDGFRSSVVGQRFALPLAKIARYISATMFLVDNEEVRSVINSLTVQIVKTPPIGMTGLEPRFDSLAKFASQLSIPEVPAQRLSEQLNSSQTRPSLLSEGNFMEVVSSKCAVHAEIQLLFEYELHGYHGSPRVIGSTKRPCFLCALFVAIHGRFRMPKSHRRLYEKWTLPNDLRQLTGATMKNMDSVLSRFFDALSACIGQALLQQPCGKIASTESFFRHSSIWARVSRALVVQDLDQHRLQSATTVCLGGQKLRAVKLAYLRASTSALVHSFMNFIRLGRGECAVFQLGVHSMPKTTLKTKTMSLLFAQGEVTEGRILKHDTSHPFLVKVHSLDMYESSATSLQQALRQVVKIDGLRPGEEIVVQQESSGSDGFHIVHRDECLYVQIHRGCLDTVS